MLVRNSKGIRSRQQIKGTDQGKLKKFLSNYSSNQNLKICHQTLQNVFLKFNTINTRECRETSIQSVYHDENTQELAPWLRNSIRRAWNFVRRSQRISKWIMYPTGTRCYFSDRVAKNCDGSDKSVAVSLFPIEMDDLNSRILYSDRASRCDIAEKAGAKLITIIIDRERGIPIVLVGKISAVDFAFFLRRSCFIDYSISDPVLSMPYKLYNLSWNADRLNFKLAPVRTHRSVESSLRRWATHKKPFIFHQITTVCSFIIFLFLFTYNTVRERVSCTGDKSTCWEINATGNANEWPNALPLDSPPMPDRSPRQLVALRAIAIEPTRRSSLVFASMFINTIVGILHIASQARFTGVISSFEEDYSDF